MQAAALVRPWRGIYSDGKLQHLLANLLGHRSRPGIDDNGAIRARRHSDIGARAHHHINIALHRQQLQTRRRGGHGIGTRLTGMRWNGDVVSQLAVVRIGALRPTTRGGFRDLFRIRCR